MSTLPNTSILASAGTGKTFQLSDRIVKLLAGGVKHEEIAALTRRAEDPLIAAVASQLVSQIDGEGENAAFARLALRELHAALL